MGSSKGHSIINLPSFNNRKVVCLTLDLEEDYGDLLHEPRYEGLEHIQDLVNFFEGRDMPLTCFVQGSLFETHSAQVERLFTLDVEFELHSYSHPGPGEINNELEIRKGKEAYRRFFGKSPVGYRSSLGVISREDLEILASNGFRFDSSIFPSLRPGVFNNVRTPTKPFLFDKLRMVEFPFTVLSSIVRVPICLSYIKLLGKPYLYTLKKSSLPNLIVIGFHLHDLFQLSSSNEIPIDEFPFIYRRVFKRIYQGSKDGLIILDELTQALRKRGYTFLRLIDVYEALCKEPCV